MTKRRVVITGMGAVTPIGKNINDFWAAIREGKCGVGPITLFDASNCPVKIAAEVKDFKPEEHDIDPKEARRMARFTQFLLAASKEAEDKLKQANTAQEDAAKAYADGKNVQKTSEEWLADCEAEIDRLEKRLSDLEKSIADVKSDLEAHRAELKKLEGK